MKIKIRKGKFMAEKIKRGQIAIWVIIGIVIVGSIILVYLFVQNGQGVTARTGEGQDTKSFVENCVSQELDNIEEEVILQGGFLEPVNYRIYNNVKVPYLCQNIGNYDPCIQQHPLYLDEIKEQLKNHLNEKITSCFDKLKDNYEHQGYKVEYGEIELNVSIAPKRIFVNINRNILISRDEQINRISEISVEYVSPLYDLSSSAREIAISESKYCYFEHVGQQIFYPEIIIDKVVLSDSTKIYTLKDKKSEKEMFFAIRGCAIPPGI